MSAPRRPLVESGSQNAGHFVQLVPSPSIQVEAKANGPPASPIAAAEQRLDLTKRQLRRMFHRFDADADGRLDHSQTRDCLEALGVALPSVHAVQELLKQIDSAHSGAVTEDEFVRFFKHVNRQSLQKIIQDAEAKDNDSAVRITLTEFGFDRADAMSVRELTIAQLAVVVAEEHPQSWTRWIDVRGLSSRVEAILEDTFSFHKRSLQDVYINQRSRVQLIKSEPPDAMRIHVITAAVSLQNAPFQEDESGALTLLRSAPEPRLVREQTSIFVISDSTLVTLRGSPMAQPVSDDPELEFKRAPSRRQPGSLFGPAGRSTKRKDSLTGKGGAEAAWNEVREELTVFPSEMRHKGAKFLASKLIDALVDYNWAVRDTFADWVRAIESAVQRAPAQWHLNHIYSMQKAIELARYDLNLAALQAIAESHGAPPSGSGFFTDEAIYLEATRVSAQHLNDSLEVLHSNSKKLQEIYSSRTSDTMNRVLYTLTLVTSTLAPLQFLTGVYGMNFRNFPEIEWELGYMYFWLLALGVFLSILAIFRYLRFINFN